MSNSEASASRDSPLAEPHHRVLLRGELATLHFDFAADLVAPWSVLFGSSGSGKSTLLRAMCGLLPANKGPGSPWTVCLSRHEPSGDYRVLAGADTDVPVHDRGIAYAPQAPSLFPHLSVGENVRFGADSQRTASALVEQACELFELAPLWSRLPARLSGGEQQRVNLARAFARPNSHLLLMDEPFTGMDRSLRDRLLERLRPALAARKLPVLSVTHDVEEAFLLEAEVLRLADGKLVAQGPVARVLSTEAERIREALH